ncbi:MAG: transposase [Nitrospira sp.]|nr:transposase [Nitrospira sp.]
MRQLKGADGYGVERLFRCLLVQFMEDLSDRELARYLEENLAAKWLCGFSLSEPTPDYSLFSVFATDRPIAHLCHDARTAHSGRLMSEVFTLWMHASDCQAML